MNDLVMSVQTGQQHRSATVNITGVCLMTARKHQCFHTVDTVVPDRTMSCVLSTRISVTCMLTFLLSVAGMQGINTKQASLNATQLKCLPLLHECIWSCYDLELSPLTLETFPTMATHIMNIHDTFR